MVRFYTAVGFDLLFEFFEIYAFFGLNYIFVVLFLVVEHQVGG
jgi:ABC-type uncharacterized transport system permease subunit